MRYILSIVLLTLTLFATDKVALVIGNKNYINHTGLNNPIADAKLVRDTLKGKNGQDENGLGFEVIEAYNLDLDALGNKLDAFVKKASKAKIALIYYAGHGIGYGENYIIPIGTSHLSVNELKRAVANASGFGVVMFDACSF